MEIIRNLFVASILGVLTTYNSIAQQIETIKSPDEQISVELQLENGTILYNIKYNQELFLEKSPLGLETSLGDFSKNLQYVSSEISTVKSSYELKNAKVSKVDYLATNLAANFINSNEDTLVIKFRVSNRDVAFSYGIRSKEGKSNVKIFNEVSGFNLPANTTTYISPQAKPLTGWMETKPSYEEEYTFGAPIGEPSTYGVGYTFPALFKISDNGWVLISETGVDSHYLGSRLGEGTKDGLYKIAFPQEGENNGIGETFAAQALPAKTPWRTITLGNSLKPIVESTVAFDLVEEKYQPSIDYQMGRATWSWIVWQDNSINFEDQIKFIDLAEELNFEYVLVDNWWDNNIGRERIKEVVDYADSKGIGVILWYNSNGYWNEAPQTPKNRMNTSVARQQEMEWLQDIGVKGLKIDFFGGDKQTTIQLYEDILKDANNYGLAITFHGSTLPRGWERMYPNFVTSEAVLASENLVFQQEALDKHALNATILPFTRNTVGAMDFAPVFLNKKLSQTQENGTIRSTTDAFELATAVLYLSPIQHFGITPNNIEEQPEYVLDFLRTVPTVWDETVYIAGEPEKFAALARRKGDKWYIAVVNGKKQKQTVDLELPMLAGQEITHIYDEKKGAAGMEKSKIKASGKIKIKLLPEGGAIIFN